MSESFHDHLLAKRTAEFMASIPVVAQNEMAAKLFTRPKTNQELEMERLREENEALRRRVLWLEDEILKAL